MLSLVTLRYVDEARLSKGMKTLARHSIPAAILLPVAFFLSVASRIRWFGTAYTTWRS